jgi:predicted NBD/HSP70 family sugar kinase
MTREHANNTNLKKVNCNRIYKLIYQKGMISKPEIAYRLGISLPTVMQNVKLLQDAGLVEENGVLESTGGRKAVALSCVKSARAAIGVDITRNHISVVLVNLDGSIAESIREKISYQDNIEYAKKLWTIVDHLIEQSKFDSKKILGMGISVPGILSNDQQILLHSHVLQVKNVRCADLAKFCPFPSVLCNDANAAGIAETWNKEAHESSVYLFLSDSVGGAILLENKLYQGEDQRGGEFGHITIERGGRRCYCGKKGCLDSYCSASVLSDLTDGNLADFFKLLKEGNPKIKTAWENYLDYLATAVNNLRMSFDCSVIIGGYVGAYIEDYIDDLMKRAAELNTFEEDGNYIKACCYRTEAAAVGAALLHIAPFIDQI